LCPKHCLNCLRNIADAEGVDVLRKVLLAIRIVSVAREPKLSYFFTKFPAPARLQLFRRSAFISVPRRFCSLELQFRGWQPPKSFAMGSRKPLKTWLPYSPNHEGMAPGAPDLILRLPLLTATGEKSDFRFFGDLSAAFTIEKAQLVARSEDLAARPCSPDQTALRKCTTKNLT
jgi:hypothetical protein